MRGDGKINLKIKIKCPHCGYQSELNFEEDLNKPTGTSYNKTYSVNGTVCAHLKSFYEKWEVKQ